MKEYKYVDIETNRFKPSAVPLRRMVKFKIKVLEIEENIQLNPDYPTTNRIIIELLEPEKYPILTWLYKGRLLKKLKEAMEKKETFTFSVVRVGERARDIRYMV